MAAWISDTLRVTSAGGKGGDRTTSDTRSSPTARSFFCTDSATVRLARPTHEIGGGGLRRQDQPPRPLAAASEQHRPATRVRSATVPARIFVMKESLSA